MDGEDAVDGEDEGTRRTVRMRMVRTMGTVKTMDPDREQTAAVGGC